MRTTRAKQAVAWDAEPEFVSVPAAARILDVSESCIRNFFSRGRLKRFKVGARSVARRSDVIALAVPTPSEK